MKEPLLISACLYGIACRYDGKDNRISYIELLQQRYTLIPCCPEVMGGLPTPRTPAERRGRDVITRKGVVVTREFQRGVYQSVQLAKQYGCKVALLKANSPSCGCGFIYDGTFTHTLIVGDGLLTEALKDEGIHVFTEKEIEKLL
ncbi:DUF523 domain-containing protein [Veillonella montpellierensis]|uniref:DUF523 domain-containing protein n=1 Tax=Veillonella montpellierensis TaxID=187328 RepID=UPI0023F660F0|nr:DUF523 domain-containing protein [Veillonella montpellierensis]